MELEETNGEEQLKGLSRKRWLELLLSLQTLILTLLLYWLYLETQDNAFFRTWLSQNFSIGLILLNQWIVAGAISELLLVTGYWIIRLETRETRRRPEVKPTREQKLEKLPEKRPVLPPTPQYGPLQPIYQTVELRSFIVLLMLGTQALSLWFITASSLSITSFTANSFYYYSHLPFTYWWGLAATLALFLTRPLFHGRAQIGLDISSIFLLAFYLVGLPSFTYQDPRFLDAYYHTGNALDLLNYKEWLTSPNWYVHQFPGVFAFVAQLISVAGIDPFQLLRFYPIGLSLAVVFLAYVITRMHSPTYASLASGVLLGGLWFQLHISPQSLELILYLGIIFLLLKNFDDEPRRRIWTILALVSTPILVASHPETPLALGLGLAGVLVLSLLRSRQMLSQQLSKFGLPLAGLVAVVLLWWSGVAVDARMLVQTSILDRALQALLRGPIGAPTQTGNVAATPSYSYGLTILSEQMVSVIVWAVGLTYFATFRKLHLRELFLAGLFLAAVSTIPIAVFGRADVLQRSYLFALFPLIILTAWLLERKTILVLRGRSLFRPLRVGFIITMILFAIIIPLTRYGIDPIEYLPASSLNVSNVAASLQTQHSLLFFHPEEDGFRFYAGLNGAFREPRSEQKTLANLPGAFVKPATDPTIPGFNLTYTKADRSFDYVVITSYWQNLYLLRFGPSSGAYVQAHDNYTALLGQDFNIVYSTGTDQIYANTDLG